MEAVTDFEVEAPSALKEIGRSYNDVVDEHIHQT